MRLSRTGNARLDGRRRGRVHSAGGRRMNVFEFSSSPIDAAALAAAARAIRRGGFAAFEGRVRDLNEGRRVNALDYEAFEALATAEGESIVEAALQPPRRASRRVACTGSVTGGRRRGGLGRRRRAAPRRGFRGLPRDHRRDQAPPADLEEGALRGRRQRLGELRAWGGTRRRRASIIRGSSRCRRSGKPGRHASRRPRSSWSAQEDSAVPCSPASRAPASAELTIVDPDCGRCFEPAPPAALRRLADIGRPKAEAAAARLAAYNPASVAAAGGETLRRRRARPSWSPRPTSWLIAPTISRPSSWSNDAAMRAGVPAVIASVYQYEGQLQVVRADHGGSCLRCQWPEATQDGLVGNCAEAGVLGPVPAVLGHMQAMEVLKLLLDLPGQVEDELLLVDLLAQGVRRLSAPRNPACADRCVRIGTAAAGNRRRRRHAAACGRGRGRLSHRGYSRAAGTRIRADAR